MVDALFNKFTYCSDGRSDTKTRFTDYLIVFVSKRNISFAPEWSTAVIVQMIISVGDAIMENFLTTDI